MAFSAPGQFQRLDEIIAFWALSQPSAAATVLRTERLTYVELGCRVDELAQVLVAAGVTKGDRVATLQTPHPDFLVTLLAATSIGAIWVGLNPKYQEAEIVKVLNDCQPRVLITRTSIEGRSYLDLLADRRKTMPYVEQCIVFDGDRVPDGTSCLREFCRGLAGSRARLASARQLVRSCDPCLLVYTSGSTGTPKGALLSHGGILQFARLQNTVWSVDSQQRVLNYFPINHVGSVVDCSLPCLAAGGTVVFMEAFDPRESLQWVDRGEITVLGSVPSAYLLQMADPQFRRINWSAVKLLVWEGAAMPEEAVDLLLTLGPPLATNYNMTEASAITVVTPTRDRDHLANSVGFAYPGVDIRLIGTDDDDVGQDETGEVWVRSPTNFLGYWNRPEATAAALRPDGYFRTGDLAVKRADGRYRLVGRLSEMFKSGGYNVYPREVELTLEKHPAVALAAVVSVPDPLWQEVGVAYVVPKTSLTAADLAEWCSSRLANYKRPKHIVVGADVPLLPIGKIDKRMLRQQALQLPGVRHA